MPGLTLLGTGMQAGHQTTPEARFALEAADRVFLLLHHPLAEAWVKRINARSESLAPLFHAFPAAEAYRRMAERVLGAARTETVAVALYGHPAIHVSLTHHVVGAAHAEEIPCRILPGISSEDCLFAELGLDPATRGCRSYDATDFLLFDRPVDTGTLLILWQAGAIGFGALPANQGLSLLAETLMPQYGGAHAVQVVRTATSPMEAARHETVALQELPGAAIDLYTTVIVPPLAPGRPDSGRARALGIPL